MSLTLGYISAIKASEMPLKQPFITNTSIVSASNNGAIDPTLVEIVETNIAINFGWNCCRVFPETFPTDQ